MGRRNRTYDKEFKENAVKLVLEKGKAKKEVARDLGINKSTLLYWVVVS